MEGIALPQGPMDREAHGSGWFSEGFFIRFHYRRRRQLTLENLGLLHRVRLTCKLAPPSDTREFQNSRAPARQGKEVLPTECNVDSLTVSSRQRCEERGSCPLPQAHPRYPATTRPESPSGESPLTQAAKPQRRPSSVKTGKLV